VAFSPDSKTLASGSYDGTMKLWDPAAGNELRTLKGHTNRVLSAAYSPDGKRIVSGGADGTVRLWDVDTGQEVQPLTGPVGAVSSIAFSPDDRQLLTGEVDIARLWNTANGQELRPWVHSHRSATHLAFSPDGRHAFCNGDNAELIEYEVGTGKEVGRFHGHAGGSSILGLALAPNGSLLVTSATDRTMRLWDVGLGRELRQFEGNGVTRCPAFMPDARSVIAYCEDGSVRIWDVANGRELNRLEEMKFQIDSVAVSPDGRRVAGRCYNQLHVWHLDNNQWKHQALAWHDAHGGFGMVFSPDGKLLASSDMLGVFKLWDAGSVSKLQEWRLPGSIRALAFAHDGRHLAIANGNGTAYILRLDEPPPKPLSAEEARRKQEAAARQLGVPVTVENSIGMKLNLIPAGKFLMGSPEREQGRQASEGPQHEVTITKPFHIGVYEVTQAEYEKVIGKNPSKFNKDNGGGPDHPVETVSWDDAVAFCKQLSELPEEKKAGRVYRLPTEAEWEHAGRAGSTTAFFFGEASDELRNYAFVKSNGNEQTHRVGSLTPNGWGLYDTCGNVWEYCAHGLYNYSTSTRVDPQGLPDVRVVVVRGGSFAYGNFEARSAYRGLHTLPGPEKSVGFRVVCEIRLVP
jgi:formylglycine-generating enzyme required for sulfatase activity